ncbi:3-hydroxyacyl-CoA dehydrogenase family protein [Patulibacter brassicae]|jgi:3-hydroxybutyryl-CoA dehydrogenase|uniref:3-hydroxyacyl-CoA dehydrogenase family protein n=1 Tax=Patulibacter brassicae TaxID=1705717 RepID=A0ABU4VNL5_9ACTN|nr:3-hydroxyacyl-CoA dehydrogenase family protein [Patulibacter brassicae]MDX8153030.1 3-hydroxyacyl-CoA dehydrogenase family protein [Patulibacter brassicae]
MSETVAVAGSGTIATGLAVTAARHADVVLWARSEASAARAKAAIEKQAAKLEVDAARVDVVTELSELGRGSIVVEAVAEDPEVKAVVLGELVAVAGPDAILASTTSSLSIEKLGEATGAPERFVGLHVFNPVPKMKLVELVFPAAATDATKDRVRALVELWEKVAVEVPDTPGFVVNKLLFPYLFSAVELQEQTGVSPADIDTAMTLGTGQPMGPFALLDFVGLDVSKAIGEVIGAPIPASLDALVDAGKLGRKSGEGFLDWRK